MKTISKKAGLETEYTNHCIRATSITALHRAGTDAQSITYVSGHKHVTGLEPVWNRIQLAPATKKNNKICQIHC